MTTLSSLSKFLLALTFVTVGTVGTAEAAPAARRAVRQANAAPRAVHAHRPVQAQRGNRADVAQAFNRPVVVAQADTRAAKDHRFDRKERHAARIARFDTNKNGHIEGPERLAIQEQRFAKLDANGDGAITLAELQAAREAHRQQRAMHPGKEGRRDKGQRVRMGKDQGKRAARFAKLDSDGNGSVSWQEFSTAKPRGFGSRGHGPGAYGEGKRRGRF